MFWQKLCNESKTLGVDTTLSPLNNVASKGGFEKDRLALIVTTTYNGHPPENAKNFTEFCKGLQPKSLSSLKVAIIDIGNSNWKSFQAFPFWIKTVLCSNGAERLCRRGVADKENDIQVNTHSWVNFHFWQPQSSLFGSIPTHAPKIPSITLIVTY